MTRHLFGSTSSPSMAGYALKRAAKDNEVNVDEETLNTVNRNFFVDDCLSRQNDSVDFTIRPIVV